MLCIGFFFFFSSSSSSFWHYNSLRVWACSTTFFHASLSMEILFQFWTFIFPRSALAWTLVHWMLGSLVEDVTLLADPHNLPHLQNCYDRPCSHHYHCPKSVKISDFWTETSTSLSQPSFLLLLFCMTVNSLLRRKHSGCYTMHTEKTSDW